MKVLDFVVVAMIGVLMVGLVYAEGGGGIYKVNEDGSVTFIESAENAPFPKWLEEPCDKNKNCVKVTTDSLPTTVSGKDYGYTTGKKAGDTIDPFVGIVKYFAYAENNVYGLWCYAWSNRNGAWAIGAYNYVRCGWF